MSIKVETDPEVTVGFKEPLFVTDCTFSNPGDSYTEPYAPPKTNYPDTRQPWVKTFLLQILATIIGVIITFFLLINFGPYLVL